MEIEKIFYDKFAKNPENIFWSPGRVNIIGEHTDYHDGFVMPTAINLGIAWAVSRRDDDQINGYSKKFDETAQFKIADQERTEYEWLLYIQGVVEIMKKRGKKIGGLDFAIDSTLPIGSGLSSSSSLATGFTFILNEVFNLGFDRREIAKIACEAEWWYGTTGGIMDQFCIANGEKNKAVLLDCRSLEHRLITMPTDIEIVVFETTIRHKQVNSPFDLRRRQAQRVIDIAKIKFKNQNIIKLRDLNLDMLDMIHDDIIKELGEDEGGISYLRALHPITENVRVLAMEQALRDDDKVIIGELLAKSHSSLRDNYQVSCAELDAAVDIALSFSETIGSRMVGGGFGGCTINLIKKGHAQYFVGHMEEKFRKATGIKGNGYICLSSDGASKIH